MSYQPAHEEPHFVTRAGWLRAAVLGANDGIVSVSALMVGVAAADPGAKAVLLAGVAGLTAGAMSMAAGEYVSVSSQADVERADIARERHELTHHPAAEEAELVSIYEGRGLRPETARQVARELTEHNALDAHIRDELGLSEITAARPLQAAWTSALTFSAAGSVPIAAAILAPATAVAISVVTVTLIALFILGVLGAYAGDAPVLRAGLRVLFWGALAMAVTALIGTIFGVAV